jgi:hypothetical protein
MEIEKQFSNCGCAVMRDEDTGQRNIQPGLGCDAMHDWSLILASLDAEMPNLFDSYMPEKSENNLATYGGKSPCCDAPIVPFSRLDQRPHCFKCERLIGGTE